MTQRPDAREVARQVEATQSRPARVLPDAWFETGVAEQMADWIVRSKQEQQ